MAALPDCGVDGFAVAFHATPVPQLSRSRPQALHDFRMCTSRRERGRAIIVMLGGTARDVTKSGSGAFDGLRVRDADARCKDVPEKMRVKRRAERAPRQLGDGDGNRVFGKGQSRSAEPQATPTSTPIEPRAYMRQVMIEQLCYVLRDARSVGPASLGLAAANIDAPDACPPLHVSFERERREVAEP